MSLRPTSIICAIDFSPFSNFVIANGLFLAAAFDARLTVFNTVFHPQDPYYNADAVTQAGKVAQQTREAREKIDTLMADCPVAWTPLVTRGEPVAELARAARQYNADLVIAASHGISGWKRMFIGTVVERMARSLPVPMLITRKPSRDADLNRTARGRFKKLLVACDATADCDPALNAAAHFAQHFNAELHICHVMESPVAEDVLSPTDGPYEQVQETLQQRLKQRMQAMMPPDIALNIPPVAVVAHGLPSEALLQYTRHQNPDLTFVGVRREGILKKRVIGSTTEALLRHASGQTMIVPLSDCNDRKSYGDRQG